MGRVSRDERRPRLIVAGRGTKQPAPHGREAARKSWCGGKWLATGGSSARRCSAGYSECCENILTNAPRKAKRQPLREGLDYLMMNIFGTPTSIWRRFAWKGLGNLVDTDDDICKCTLAARGLNIPERPQRYGA